MGFKEIPHTADWALRVWADDLAALLAEAARAMNSLAGVVIALGAPVSRRIELQERDPESLLVSFLTELLYLQEQEKLAFDHFEVRLDGNELKADITGGIITTMDKAIKAVTWHNL